MKKTSTYNFLLALCLMGTVAGCSKEVKAPAKVANTMASKSTTTTQTTNQNQGGHTCGSHTSQTDGGD